MSVGVCGVKNQKPDSVLTTREYILELIFQLRNAFYDMTDEELSNIRLKDKPFWYLINGPIADALTHVGQINMLRRTAGFPPLKYKPFYGTPPEDTN